MCRFRATYGAPAAHLVTIVLVVGVWALVSPAAIATAPGPESTDPGVGKSWSRYPQPPFAEGYRAVHRPLRTVTGEGRAVALLVDFPDRPANRAARPVSFYRELLFSKGTHPTGSFRDYFLEQSYGSYDVTGEVYGWLRTSEYYYTTFDDGNFGASGGARGVGIAGILLVDPTVDFGAFDSDGPDGTPNSGDDDGYVDACLVFVSQLSGVDTGNRSDFWPVNMAIIPDYVTDDPAAGGGFIRIDGITIQPEINLDFPFSAGDTLDSFLGVVTHEYGHMIGLPDLYDGSRVTWGIGYWGVMGYGSYGWRRTGPYQLSAWSKVQLGWVTPTVVTQDLTDLLIPPVETNPVVYQVWRDGVPGDEYFLLENRQNILYDTHLPGRGLLIWHVDRSTSLSNAAPYFDFWIGLEQADGRNDMNTYFDRADPSDYYPEMGDGGDPFPGDSLNTVFDRFSNPSSEDNDGLPTGVGVKNITLEGDNIRLDILIDDFVAVFFHDGNATVTDSGVEITWSVFSDEPLEGFKVYRRIAGVNDFSLISGNDLIARDERRYVDSNVQPGNNYQYAVGAVRPDGSEVRSAPIDATVDAPDLVLHQNFPNPFNPSTSISFSLPEAARVDLAVFDVEGKLVRMLVGGLLPRGLSQVQWDGTNEGGERVGSGIYLYRLRAGKRVLTRKMILLK
jgi:M6 family metalloprotease-like protein